MKLRSRRVAVIASASGNGKTTLGKQLAERLDVPFVELDALVHGPNWAEISDEGLRQLLEPIVAGEGWVVDGDYHRKIGNFVLERADTIVWLDQPIRVWLPRLLRRTVRRMLRRERLWNDNRESLRDAFWGRESLVGYALGAHFRNRRELPARLAPYRVVRLRTPSEVDRFVRDAVAT